MSDARRAAANMSTRELRSRLDDSGFAIVDTDWDVQQLESSLLQTFAAEDDGE